MPGVYELGEEPTYPYKPLYKGPGIVGGMTFTMNTHWYGNLFEVNLESRYACLVPPVGPRLARS